MIVLSTITTIILILIHTMSHEQVDQRLRSRTKGRLGAPQYCCILTERIFMAASSPAHVGCHK